MEYQEVINIMKDKFNAEYSDSLQAINFGDGVTLPLEIAEEIAKALRSEFDRGYDAAMSHIQTIASQEQRL